MGAARVLSRQEIIDAKDIDSQTIDVPEWGGSVVVRVMSAADRNRFEQSIVSIDKDGKRVPSMENFRCKVVCACLVDERGFPLFGPDEIDDLAMKSSQVIERLADIALAMNGMGANAVDDAVKNSEPAPSADFFSASP